MVEKIIQTRIINKNSSLGEWLEGNFNRDEHITGADRLKKGEIALAYVEIPKTDAEGNLKNTPVYLMKIGDGIKTFSELEWLSAPASDVYAWAKATRITYEQGVLTLEQGAEDGSDLVFDFKNNFYTQAEVDALLAQKAEIDHGKHLTWSKSAPIMDGKATVGVSERAARADHVHPTDITRAAAHHTHTFTDLPETMPPSAHDHNELYYEKKVIDDFALSIHTDLQKKANFNHNHSGVYTTPTEVDQKCIEIAREYLSQIGRALTFKGALENTQELPASELCDIGDIWNILTDCDASGSLPAVSAGDIVAWNGVSWVVLGTSVELNFYEKEEADEKFTNKPTFSKVTIDGASIPIEADRVEDTLILSAGDNIEFTSLPEAKKLIIASKDTNSMTSIYVGKSGITDASKSNQIQEDPYIKIFDDNLFRNQIQLKGDAAQENGITKVTSDSSGAITISAFPSDYIYIFDGGLATDL